MLRHHNPASKQDVKMCRGINWQVLPSFPSWLLPIPIKEQKNEVMTQANDSKQSGSDGGNISEDYKTIQKTCKDDLKICKCGRRPHSKR